MAQPTKSTRLHRDLRGASTPADGICGPVVSMRRFYETARRSAIDRGLSLGPPVGRRPASLSKIYKISSIYIFYNRV